MADSLPRPTGTLPSVLERDVALARDVIFSEEIVVVGTRRTDRTVIESTVPIDVLPAQDIQQSGLTETNQILEMLVPSFNFTRPTVTDGTDHIRPATLRGLSPGSTVSGKLAVRYQPSEPFALRAAVSNGFRAPSLAQSSCCGW